MVITTRSHILRSRFERLVTERQEREDGEADEDEDSDSPSPASTDTDSDDSPRDASAVRLVSAERERVASGSASASAVRSKSRSQTRSRKNSVTLRPKNKRSATLAVTVHRNDPKSLAKQGSMNSMRTVMAEENTSLQQPEHAHDGLEAAIMGRKESDHRRMMEGGAIGREGSPLSIKRGVSVGGIQAAGSLFASTSMRGEKEERSEENGVQDQRFKAEIEKQHETMKGWSWKALKAALEAYAEEGDVQICAMMALIAGEELQVKPSRLVRFVDSYIGEQSFSFCMCDRIDCGIDRLTRFKLYTAAAYLRKHAPAEDARAATNVSSRSD